MIMTCGDDEENGGEDDQGDYDLGLHESIALGLQACTEQAAKSVADLLIIIISIILVVVFSFSVLTFANATIWSSVVSLVMKLSRSVMMSTQIEQVKSFLINKN